MVNMHKSVTALLAGVAAILVAPDPSSAQRELSEPPLTIVSFGGAYTKSLMLAYVQPYRKSSGRWVEVDDYDGRLAGIRAQVRALNVKWDVVDVLPSDAARGCEEGLFERIDPVILAPAPDGTPAARDFIAGALRPCAIGAVMGSMVVAYNPARFSGTKPTTLADFYDTKRFPGPRGLPKNAQFTLMSALLGDGVPPGQVYQELSKPQGVDRAFKVLDRIRGSIVWWEDGSEPQDWLAQGRVVMSQATNGRVFEAIKDRGADLAIIWDGQIIDLKMWAITKGSNRKQQALDFLVYATEAKRLAEQANVIAYGPARRSSMAFVSPDVKSFLPTAQGRLKTSLRSDPVFWAKNYARLRDRFDTWVNTKPWRPNFHPADGN